jgi:hypothetical protein
MRTLTHQGPSEKKFIFFRGEVFFSLPARHPCGGARPLMGDPVFQIYK